MAYPKVRIKPKKKKKSPDVKLLNSRSIKQQKILDYFKDPTEENSPEAYIVESPRSLYLVRVIERLFPDRKISILELGSGTGRNLHFLKAAGYSNLSGIEQSPVYLDAMNKHFPELHGCVIPGLVEETLFDFTDLIFTMAFLEHIPEGQVFDTIANSCTNLITIEDEYGKGDRHYPRNYKSAFESRGMTHIKSWRFPPLSNNFVMRLFRKELLE